MLAAVALGFFDVKSLYEKYEYYYNRSSYLQNTIIALKPIARLTVAASSNIKKGSPLLEVPADDIITTFDDFPWKSQYQNESSTMIASAILISYKMDNSSSLSRSLYINNFNSDIEPPGYWLEDELKVWLTKFVEFPNRVRTKFPEFDKYKEIAMKIEGLRSLAYEVKSYAWAQAFTLQHGIRITKKDWKTLRGINVENGDENIIGFAFVPLFELFNQYQTPDNNHIDGKYPVEFIKGKVILSAQKDFGYGEETLVPYLHKNNHELVEDFGFSIPFNRHEYIEITVPVYSELCKNTDNGCTFRVGTVELNENLVKFYADKKNPLISYRQNVRSVIRRFKYTLRHQRRRVKILEDRHLKQIFHLSISEKWTAYKSLALVDRALLKSFTSSLKLV